MGESISRAIGIEETKICAVVPCRNAGESVGEIVKSLAVFSCPTIVVDDASDVPVRCADAIAIIRRSSSIGKAAALQSGFAKARELGFTHVLTIDADGQHDASKASEFISETRKFPSAIILGVRDFSLPAVPPVRAFMNRFSNFWAWAETGVRFSDTQCGYRCYPLGQLSRLRTKFGGFVFETEILVRASWAGIAFREVAIPTIYGSEKSHYRAFADTAKFTLMNTKLFFMSLFLSKKTLRRNSVCDGECKK